MNLERVRGRIQYFGEFKPTLDVLNDLQKQFLLHVPFENLDIHLNIPLDYSSKNVFNKIIENHRGGVCYENNSLFYDILKAIGFQVNFISGEMFKGLPLKNDLDHMHMALLVRIDDEIFLVDVGNGKSFGSPIPIIKKTYSKGEDSDYIVDDFQDMKALYFKDSNGVLTPRYVFDLFPKKREDFKQACVFIETSTDSVFLKETLVSLYQEEGRTTLTGAKLISTKGVNKLTSYMSSIEELKTVLKSTFNIALDEAQLEQLHKKTNELLIL
ncbi:acetyltransferase [Yeosuana aromativorans]|uniref:Acetyltransferase n=1 Tax=Yeosuana aromativorans TaxID=288019 RepID=A0A8J3FLE2_9FLAO|nr:arylamine N-acetyltransferase [Yeosuana aromativorans]GGK33870.1 acetyltransferase [Yeosuana aromativorans]